MKKKIKKSTILINAAVVIFIVGALSLCFRTIVKINERMSESAISNLLSTTQVISDTIGRSIENDYTALMMLGETYLIQGAQSEHELDQYAKLLEIDWVAIADENGNAVDSCGNEFNVHSYEETGKWNLLEKGYSSAYIGRLSGRLQITMWVPIYDNDVFVGNILSNVLLSRYYSANIFTFYGGDGRTYIFDAENDGAWIIKSLGTDGTLSRQTGIYKLLADSGNSEQSIAEFRAAIEAGESGVATTNFNGQQSYLCFLPLKDSPNWYVTTVIARESLLTESMDVQRLIAWLVLILSLTMLAAAIAIAVWRLRKARNEEIHYRETLFSNISANLDSAFVIYDRASQKIAFVSDNFGRLLSLSREWVYEDASRLFDWCELPRDNESRKSFLDGTLKTAMVHEVRVANELGADTRVLRLELIPADLGQEFAVLTDITGDKLIQSTLLEATERAKAASDAKNAFLSAMSHDLRTPINGIVGMTAIASANINDPNRVRDCLTKISDSSAHLLSLVNEVLEMSQIESGKIELLSEPFNIAELLSEVLSVNYPGIEEKNHKVKVNVKLMQHEEVIGDPTRLKRVTENLISNAIKYTPEGGLIQLALREKEAEISGFGCYELTIADNGIGISREFKDRIFEPFEREEDVVVNRIQGTGLGMSIVKSIVDLMMGKIEIESEKGKGTLFRVTVNLKLNHSQEPQNSLLRDLPVLVVDDDADVRSSVCEILNSLGMCTETASNGEKAIEMAKRRHDRGEDYIAAIIDWQMPEMNGVETSRIIRAECGNVLYLVLAAYDWAAVENEARAAGIDSFLFKPFYRAKLMQKMTEIACGKNDAVSPVMFETANIPSGKRVLVAEDNDLNREIAIEFLHMLGVEADCAENGQRAIDLFAASEEGYYDMILMDVQMPRQNGYQATRAIRKLERADSGTIPIVAMTADTFKKDEQNAREAGMNDHIPKPVSVDRLAAVLRRFLTIEEGI